MGSATPSLNKSLLKSKYFTLMDSHPTSCFKAPSPITRCPTESSPRRPHHLLFDYAPPHTLPIIILLIRSRRTSGRASSRPGQAGAVTKRRPGRGASSSVAKRLTSERGQGTLRTRVCVCVCRTQGGLRLVDPQMRRPCSPATGRGRLAPRNESHWVQTLTVYTQ